MYRKLFENFRELKTNEDYPLVVAKEFGLNMNQFKKDFADPQTGKTVDKEMEQMRNSGIPRMSVPKFLINGKEPQQRDFAAWSKIIDAEIAKAKTKAKARPSPVLKKVK